MIFKEDQHTELIGDSKSSTIIKNVVSFLNTCDGTIYIGVKDNGTIVGINDIDKASIFVSDIIADQIEPSPRDLIEIDTPVIEKKQLIKISVKRGSKLYYVKKYGMSSSGCFERIGTSSRGMTPSQISKRMLSSLKAEMKITSMPSEKKKLSFRYIKFLYVQEGMNVNDSSFCKNESFYNEDGEYNILAELLSDENRFSIKVVRFDGNDKGCNILLRNEYGYQCLITAMKNAQSFCADVLNQTKTVFHRDGYREDIPLFDRIAFREAWYNACLHNDWVDGTPPAIYVFNDRLEIISTGGLPHNMTKEDFFGGVSKPVNEALAKIFIKLGLIEQTGHGVTAITDKYGKEAFTFLDNFLRVTIPFNYKLNEYIKSDENANGTNDGSSNDTECGTDNGASNGTDNGTECGTDNDTDTIAQTEGQSDEEKLIAAIKENPEITTIDMMKLLNKSRRTVSRIISKSTKIVRVGPDFGGHWEIKE